MNNEKFRWAYVGCGSIANKTASQICKGNHVITAVFSRNTDKANTFAEKYNATAFDSFDAMMDFGKFDAVYVGTPHDSHTKYSLEAMKRGFPVLCEKPAGVSCDDIKSCIEYSENNKIYYAEAMWTWFGDVSIKVKEWINSGVIGDVKKCGIAFAFPGILMNKESRLLTSSTAGGALLDIGIYPIAYAYHLFGYPQKIFCKGKVLNGIDLGEKIILDYGKFKCKLDASLCYPKEYCKISCTQGYITLPRSFYSADRAVLIGNNYKDTITANTDYLNEFTRVSEEIKEGLFESRFVSHKATLDCLKIMDECRRQLKLVYPFEK